MIYLKIRDIMIENRKELKEWLRYESSKYKQNGIKYYLKLLSGSENAVLWNFQKRLRITEYHKNTRHRLRYFISKIILRRKQNKYMLNIAPNVFGKGLKIMHLGPILTNGEVRVGENCSVHINTSFVAGGRNDGVPQIGSDCVIGVGAVILGAITIADGIAIGANAVVNKSFTEPDIAIAGVPARKISNNGKKSWRNDSKK